MANVVRERKQEEALKILRQKERVTHLFSKEVGESDNGPCMLVKEGFSEVGECSLKVMTFVDP